MSQHLNLTIRTIFQLSLIFGISASSAVAIASNYSKFSPELATAVADGNDNVQWSTIVYLVAQADIENLDRYCTGERVTRGRRHQLVIGELQTVAAHSQPAIAGCLESLQLQGSVVDWTAYWIVNAIVVSATREGLFEIQNHSAVDWIDFNFKAKLIEPKRSELARQALDENHGVPTGIRAVGARRVWLELGFTGAGRLVGNIDTGVDGGHPALASRWRGLEASPAECWLDVTGNSTFPEDDPGGGGHGTHTMGTICGNSTTSNDSIGVAPRAHWIACNAIAEESGDAFNNSILEAFQWMADPDGNGGTINDVPDVVQNSWGVDGRFPGYSDCFQIWNQVIVNCEAAGVAVIFSAGNEGPAERTLRSPATMEIDSVTVFSVGAVDADADTVPPYVVAGFSSRGPTDCPPFLAIKPEVCAPGVDVYSALPSGYGRLSGTSMAGPHVAGIIALMREANPNAEVREMKSVLMRTAHDVGPAGEDNDYGFGFVDAYQAVLEISSNRALLIGYVTNSANGEAIAQAHVSAGQRFSTRSDNNGLYRLSVIGDTLWSLTVTAYGFEDHLETVTVASGETLEVNTQLVPLPQATIRGFVMAGANVPVPGATIVFVGVPLPELTTNGVGEFSATVPGDSTYLIRALFDGVAHDTSLLATTGSTHDLALYLESSKSNPTGPDSYGYRAYDRFDNGLPPQFAWLEIAPRRNGVGQELSFADRDSSAYIALPFPFVYYGQTFDSLTINENGWIAAGISHDHSFFNFAIPAAAGPPGMLALFWDNLHLEPDSSQICYFFDSLHCRLIIEYYDMRFLPATGSHLTCQLQIFDPVHVATPSGDCEFIALYERIDLPSSSTIGIENITETAGLQLLFNGTSGDAVWSVMAGSAVLYTTRTLPRVTGTVSGNIISHPLLDSYGSAIVAAGCQSVSAGIDGSFTIEDALTGAQTALLVLPDYELDFQQIPVGTDSTTNLTFDVWRLDPPRTLTGFHDNQQVHLSWLEPESIGGRLDDFLFYEILRDNSIVAQSSVTQYSEPLPGTALYDYAVRAVYDGGQSINSNHVLIDGSVPVAEQPAGLPRTFRVDAPYPNPFNSSCEFVLALPRDAAVSITVFNLAGQQVALLMDGQLAAGYHRVSWQGRSQSSGLYFVHVQAGTERRTQKLLLIR